MDGFHEKFTFEELTRTKHKHLQLKNRTEAQKFINAGKRLSKMLGSVREQYGVPLNVSSGYRCLELNIAVGSKAKSSTHMKFEAADIVPSGRTAKQFFDWLYENKEEFGDLRKAIYEEHKGIVHVEVKMHSDEPLAFYTTNDNVSFKGVV
jgi:hypothetical protein